MGLARQGPLGHQSREIIAHEQRALSREWQSLSRLANHLTWIQPVCVRRRPAQPRPPFPYLVRYVVVANVQRMARRLDGGQPPPLQPQHRSQADSDSLRVPGRCTPATHPRLIPNRPLFRPPGLGATPCTLLNRPRCPDHPLHWAGHLREKFLQCNPTSPSFVVDTLRVVTCWAQKHQ